MSSRLKPVTIYTDGACEPNPGPGGYGIVIISGAARKELSGGFKLTTNNRMEIYAAMKALENLKSTSKVTLYSDSEYLVKAMALGWVQRWKAHGWKHNKRERAANIDLWEKLLALCEKHQVEFVWVKGHAGHPENERCDQLSYLALKGNNLPVDDGFVSNTELDQRTKTFENPRLF
jgi:ribonuclease HI